jgi:hypothetical protein
MSIGSSSGFSGSAPTPAPAPASSFLHNTSKHFFNEERLKTLLKLILNMSLRFRVVVKVAKKFGLNLYRHLQNDTAPCGSGSGSGLYP